MVALAISACGGGGSDSGTADRPTTTELGTEEFPRLQPGNRPVRFRLDTSVSPELQAFVLETLSWAHSDVGDSGPLTVHVYSDEDHFIAAYTNEYAISIAEARQQLADGQTVFASPGGHIWIYLVNFEEASVPLRRLALFHEYTHTLQFWLAEIRFQSTRPQERSFVPRWLVEGCAEYVSTRKLAARGVVDEARIRRVTIAFARDVTQPLTVYETAGQAAFLGGNEASYDLGYLACERLADVHGIDKVNEKFWTAFDTHRDWRKAFQESMGRSPDDFYADFESYRRTL